MHPVWITLAEVLPAGLRVIYSSVQQSTYLQLWETFIRDDQNHYKGNVDVSLYRKKKVRLSFVRALPAGRQEKVFKIKMQHEETIMGDTGTIMIRCVRNRKLGVFCLSTAVSLDFMVNKQDVHLGYEFTKRE